MSSRPRAFPGSRRRRGSAAAGPRAVQCALLLVLAVGCSSDKDDGVDLAGFGPDIRSPAAGQVFIAFEGSDAQQVAVAVRIRETPEVAGADLTLTYDPFRVLFRSWSPGSLLESNGGTAAYQVGEAVPGTLRILATRTSGGSATAGSDDPPLVVLSFTVVQRGDAPVAFVPGSDLLDGLSDPIPGLTFFGGTFTGI